MKYYEVKLRLKMTDHNYDKVAIVLEKTQTLPQYIQPYAGFEFTTGEEEQAFAIKVDKVSCDINTNNITLHCSVADCIPFMHTVSQLKNRQGWTQISWIRPEPE